MRIFEIEVITSPLDLYLEMFCLLHGVQSLYESLFQKSWKKLRHVNMTSKDIEEKSQKIEI